MAEVDGSGVDWNGVLQAAFDACAQQGWALTPQQQQLLRAAIAPFLPDASAADAHNPLADLTDAQRTALLAFIAEQSQQNRSWKAQLLNDWLAGRDSGAVQFIRESFGVGWLERIQPIHVAQYQVSDLLKVGDRIEVANDLWEWVQESDPTAREWISCTVVQVVEGVGQGDGRSQVTCTVRFDTGMEYEIQGVYDWNRYNWRWVGLTP